MQTKDEKLVQSLSSFIEGLKQKIACCEARINQLSGEIEESRKVCDNLDNAQILLKSAFEIIGKYNSNFIAEIKSIGEIREKVKAKIPLNLTEEKFLGELIKKGDNEARELLILANLYLAKYIASQIAKKINMPFNDILQNAFLGLIDAVDKYDPVKNLRFKTYAEIRIRGGIWDGVRSDNGTVKISRFWLKKRKCVLDAIIVIQNEGHEVTIEKIVDKTKYKEDAVLEIIASLPDDFNLSLSMQNDEIYLADTKLNPEQSLILKEQLEGYSAFLKRRFEDNLVLIEDMLKKLSARQSQVIRAIYGIGGDYAELSQIEVARRLKLAWSTISFYNGKGLKKLAEIFNIDKEAVRNLLKETCLIYQILGGAEENGKDKDRVV